MALNIGAIRAALAAQIQSHVSRGVNVYDGYTPASPTPPCVLITPNPDVYITYHATFSQTGLAIVHLRLTIAVPPGPDTDGQKTLDEFLSAGTGQSNSVLDAILTDKTLGGTAGDCVVQSVEFLGRIYLSENVDQQVQADAAALLLEIHTQRA
jgi:hypothetical protein